MTGSWLRSFELSLQRNQQLAFARHFWLSAGGEAAPPLEQFTLHSTDGEGALRFVVDRRRVDCARLAGGRASAGFYFPLTREKYVFEGELAAETDEELLRGVWAGLSRQLREGFGGPAPGAARLPAPGYNPQEMGLPSANFALLRLRPARVEQCLHPLPQVIADARNPTFESEFRPYKTERRFVFTRAAGEWTLAELNP